MLTEGAIFLALAQILSMVPLLRLPNGGAVDLAMVPVLLFAFRWGVGPGLLEGFLLGLLQILTEGALAWGWQSILLDFLVAFTPLGLAGLFRNRGLKGVIVGIIVACFCRFLVHYISGVTIYAILMPTELFGITWMNKWTYSLAYNGSFMLINMIFTLLVFVLLYKPLGKYIRAEDLKKAA